MLKRTLDCDHTDKLIGKKARLASFKQSKLNFGSTLSSRTQIEPKVEYRTIAEKNVEEKKVEKKVEKKFEKKVEKKIEKKIEKKG